MLYALKKFFEYTFRKSQIVWTILFIRLNRNIKNKNLSSAIKATNNFHNLLKAEHSDFLFVVIYEIFSLSETKRIVNNIIFCMIKRLNEFGIEVGILHLKWKNLS